ncbi:MAG: aminotransferase class IV [Candidatus Aenigmarchaeota archaeon]|nr:aminotransferase class IV [Candidatus Aenigmarchaeota archaeon]
MEKGPEIWFNGRFYEGDPPVGGLFYHGLHYGTAAWEGIRRIGNNLLKLSNHVARLNFGSDSLGIGWPFKEDDFSQVILETARRNPECDYLRPVVGWGPGRDIYRSVGVLPKESVPFFAVLPQKFGSYLGEEAEALGVDVFVSSYKSVPPSSLPNERKLAGGYLNRFLAKMEAHRGGYREALMLCDLPDGREVVSEGTGENIFMEQEDGVLFTPTKDAGILPGITRETIIKELAPDLGIKIEERDFTLNELKKAKGAFFTGTAVGVGPIRSVNYRFLGSVNEAIFWKGPKTETIRKVKNTYEDACAGKIPKYEHWLTAIPSEEVEELEQLAQVLN